MNPRDVPEERARQVRCPLCAARRGYPCRSSALAHVARNRSMNRAHMPRRRAWLERNDREESTGDE